MVEFPPDSGMCGDFIPLFYFLDPLGAVSSCAHFGTADAEDPQLRPVNFIYRDWLFDLFWGCGLNSPLVADEHGLYIHLGWHFCGSFGDYASPFSTFIGKLVTKIGALIPLAISFVLFAISSFDTAFLNTDVDIWHVAFSRFLLGCGMLFFIVPLFNLQVQDIPEEKLASAAGMFHFVRAMMGGVGTSVFTTLWIRRSAFHHSNIVSELVYRKPFAPFMEQINGLDLHGDKAWAFLNGIVDTQAAVLALNDSFYLMGWCFIALLPFLLLGKSKARGSKNAPLVASE